MILGGSGAGKSHLALRLSALGRLPSYHMDELSWRPGFVHRTTAEMDSLTRAIHAQDCWVLEGGHYETSRERAHRAHLLVWLDLSPAVQSMRVIRRAIRHHGEVRPCMAEGCPEHFGRHTIDVVRYVWETRRFHCEKIEEAVAAAPAGLRIARLRTARQARRFLAGCAPAPGGPGLIIPEQV